MNINSNDIASNISDVSTESVSKTAQPTRNPNLESECFGNKLKSQRTSNLRRIIIAQINTNSIRNKYEALVNGVRGNDDILMISETKTDDYFLPRQFLIEEFTTPYRLDQNGSGGGILFYICEDIPSKLIPTDFSNREGFFLELNIRKKKWVLCCSYNLRNNVIETHMDSIGKVVDSLSARYDFFFFLIGDFNAEESNTTINDFCGIYSFKNLIKDTTCFNMLKCIDLMLTNRNRNLQNSCVFDTELADFHKVTVTILRSHLNKLGLKTIQFRDYKKISNDAFRSELVIENGNLQNCNDLDSFLGRPN